MWQEPIFDRTNADTLTARASQSNIDNHKGAINYEDLNRIEGNYQYVFDKLYSDSFIVPHVRRNRVEVHYDATGSTITKSYTDWQEQNIPWQSEIDRIRENFNSLTRIFLRGLGLPIFEPSSFLLYTEVNDWERVALAGKVLFENMEKEYRRCNTVTSGGDPLL